MLAIRDKHAAFFTSRDKLITDYLYINWGLTLTIHITDDCLPDAIKKDMEDCLSVFTDPFPGVSKIDPTKNKPEKPKPDDGEYRNSA